MTQRTRMCLVCKKLIEPERAKDYEKTSLCMEHGAAISRFGGEFKVFAEQESLAKENSFKRNPGGVRTKLVLNMVGIERLKAEYHERKSAQQS